MNTPQCQQGNFEHLSDEQLIERIQSSKVGDKAAFEALYWRHAQLLLAFLMARIEPFAVDDIAQAVWMKVWKGLSSQFHGGSFRAWLYQIATTTLIDHFRKEDMLTTPTRVDEIPADKAIAPLARMMAGEKLKVLRECFSVLADREASLLRRLLSGHTYEAICNELKLNSNVAYKTASLAKSKLRDCVTQKLS